MMKHGLAAVVFAALLPLGGCIGAKVDESAVFQPPPVERPAAAAADIVLRGEETFVDKSTTLERGFVGEGEARIAYVVASKGDPARPLVVHCGGRGSDLFHAGAHYARKVLPYGDVLEFDYPGYGASGGKANADSFASLFARMPAFLASEAKGRPIVFWGHSLGGFVCAQIAKRTPEARGMIFEASAKNATEVAHAWTPWYAGPFVRVSVAPSLKSFDSADAVKELRGPVLVLGAGQDKTLPVGLARSLARAIKAEGADVTYKEFPEAQHVTLPEAPGFGETIGAFFAKVAGEGATAPTVSTAP